VCTARNDPDAHGIDIDGVSMGSAAFKAARHEETLEAAAAVIAGIDKALVPPPRLRGGGGDAPT
jgi:hypothetical protein